MKKRALLTSLGGKKKVREHQMYRFFFQHTDPKHNESWVWWIRDEKWGGRVGIRVRSKDTNHKPERLCRCSLPNASIRVLLTRAIKPTFGPGWREERRFILEGGCKSGARRNWRGQPVCVEKVTTFHAFLEMFGNRRRKNSWVQGGHGRWFCTVVTFEKASYSTRY